MALHGSVEGQSDLTAVSPRAFRPRKVVRQIRAGEGEAFRHAEVS